MRQAWWWRGLATSFGSGAISFRGDVTTHRHFLGTIQRAATPGLALAEVAQVDAAGKWTSAPGWRERMQLPFLLVVLRKNA